MSYQVLARKWRPQQFGQLVGQDHVKAALGNALTQNRLHHAYLFTGTRGVGKTTIARIFAKSLNCETGITATPCGVCSTCVEIEKGYYVDLLEIDAASRTKVEDTRDLLDNVQYAPSRGRFKVYLIDEVHMLSKHSFNALLKTLEEPPPHVKFLLATTDPQKLPITVLSRCLQFSLKALSPLQIQQHLQMVLQQEQIAAEPEALAMLARAARGSLRDSLSLTDQAIAQTNGHISQAAVREMLGYLEQSWAELLLEAMMARDVARMQQHLLDLIRSHSQFQTILDDMLSLLHLAALSQFSLSASELSHQHSTFIRQLAKTLSPEQIQLYYQLLLSGKKELPYAPDLRIGVEMALLRAAAFMMAPQASVETKTDARSAALAAARAPMPQESVSAEAVSSSVVAAAPANATAELAIAAHTLSDHAISVPDIPQTQNIPSTHDIHVIAPLHAPDGVALTLVDTSTRPSATAEGLAASETALPAQTVATAQATQANPTATTQTAEETTPQSAPRVDPITASILARRGMAAAPASSAALDQNRQPATTLQQTANEDDVAKKSEPSLSASPSAATSAATSVATSGATTAIRTAVTGHSETSSSVAAMSAAVNSPASSAATSSTDKRDVTPVSDAPSRRASLTEADLPPWLTAQERGAALQTASHEDVSQQQASQDSQENIASSVQASAVDTDDKLERAADLDNDIEYDYIAPDMTMLLHADDHALPSHHEDAEAVTALRSGSASMSAQPIRHALLDSVPALPQTTDFAEDMANGVGGTAILAQGDTTAAPLRFDGDINAENFAVRSSGQVDDWARQIDAMPIGGLMRIFLRHSRYSWQGDVLQLTVASSQRHLDSERNRQQLQQALVQSFGRDCQLEVQFVTDVPGCPQDIQQQIEQARFRYVTQVLSHDPTLQALCQQFAAEIDWSSMHVH
jgi:DNA polymerase-3 subunit gamma/tau